MRKHNKKCAMRMGSARVDTGVPSMANSIANNKSFQLACNPLLLGMLRAVK